jgi:CubicO group peptidase (beta-lactamase class C family)
MKVRTARRSCAALIISACAAPLAAQPACTPVPQDQSHRVALLIETVNGGDHAAMDAFAREHWAAGSARDFPEAVIDQLGTEHWKSGRWTPVPPCRAGDRSAFVLVQNALTEETDSLVVLMDSAGAIERLTVWAGVRVPVAAADTASDSARIAAIGRYVGRLADAGVFSGAVAVSRDGRRLFAESYGLANRERGIPVGMETPFNLASLNKIFTATAVLQLVQRGALSLDDTLGRLLPDSSLGPAVGSVRLKHLLSHTSGITTTLDSLSFAPGTRFAYSNLGFVVLGAILEQVSGRSYDAYLRDEVFQPAGMVRTARYVLEAPTDSLAMGYTPDFTPAGLALVPNPLLHTLAGNPAGGLFSSAEDLLRFAEALRTGKLLPPAAVREMRTARTELGTDRYGFGVILWRGPGIWGHAGDLPGADTDLEFLGDTGVVSVVLSNYSAVNNPIRRRIARLWGFTSR